MSNKGTLFCFWNEKITKKRAKKPIPWMSI